jgi:hypothetical protein
MTATTEPKPAHRSVILLGLPKTHLAYLWEQALGRNTRPSVIVEELLDDAKRRDRPSTRKGDTG